jgi:hypothetical protein
VHPERLGNWSEAASATSARRHVTTPPGQHIPYWQLCLRAPHAHSLMLIFRRLSLPLGSKLYVYSPDALRWGVPGSGEGAAAAAAGEGDSLHVHAAAAAGGCDGLGCQLVRGFSGCSQVAALASHMMLPMRGDSLVLEYHPPQRAPSPPPSEAWLAGCSAEPVMEIGSVMQGTGPLPASHFGPLPVPGSRVPPPPPPAAGALGSNSSSEVDAGAAAAPQGEGRKAAAGGSSGGSGGSRRRSGREAQSGEGLEQHAAAVLGSLGPQLATVNSCFHNAACFPRQA